MRDVVIILGVIGLTAWGLSAGLASSGDLFGRLPPSPTIKYTDETYPFTHARLRERLKRLKPHVEAVVGSSIDLDDVRLVVSDPLASADLKLVSGDLDLPDPTKDDLEFLPFATARSAISHRFASTLASYDATTKGLSLRLIYKVKAGQSPPRVSVFAYALSGPKYVRGTNASGAEVTLSGMGPGRFSVGASSIAGGAGALDEETEFDGKTTVERTIDLR